EVLQLAARGLTNKDIAAVLVISPKTVANHIEHIYAKIGASTRAMAGLFAMNHGLLPEEESMSMWRSGGDSGALQLPSPGAHVRVALGHDLARAEHDELRSGVGARGVARRHVVGVARAERLLVVGEPPPHTSLEHVPPVRRGAHVTGKSLQKLGEVGVDAHLDETRCVPVQVPPPLDPGISPVRAASRFLRHTRHPCMFSVPMPRSPI